MTIDLKSLFGDLSDYDSKTTNALLRALKENFTEEFDYLRFKQSVRTMQDMGIDETTSIKSAYATASTMGLTKASLVKSALRYEQVLSKEKDNFAQALKAQMQSKIDGKRSEAVALQQRIADYRAKMLEMEKEISLYQKKIDNVEQEVERATQKIESTKVKFVKVFKGISDVIKEDRQRIEIIL